MKAITMSAVGGPEVLEWIDRPEPEAGPGQAVVEVAAAGVNFMDTGVRRGQFWQHVPFPRGVGAEGAGRVLAVGEGVSDVHVGQRVAWTGGPGSYAERLALSADELVPVPDAIDDITAAAAMMQGLTAMHFSMAFYNIQPGDIALVHAAAGGVGLLLTQIAKLKGGTVIGRVSSYDKVAVAKEAGADHVIVSSQGDFAGEVIRLSGGEGVHVVFDGSGPSTFDASLASLRHCGTFCWFGPVLGPPNSLEIMTLPRSIKIGYAVFRDSIYTPALLREKSGLLFDLIASGALKIKIGETYPMADAARAHRDMESRKTTGKLVLLP
jgi:NADPH2:quinone reductase